MALCGSHKLTAMEAAVQSAGVAATMIHSTLITSLVVVRDDSLRQGDTWNTRGCSHSVPLYTTLTLWLIVVQKRVNDFQGIQAFYMHGKTRLRIIFRGSDSSADRLGHRQCHTRQRRLQTSIGSDCSAHYPFAFGSRKCDSDIGNFYACSSRTSTASRWFFFLQSC